MRQIDIPKELFVMGEFYPFSSETKQAIPFWYNGAFFGVVFERVENCITQPLLDRMKAHSHVGEQECCYYINMTKIDQASGFSQATPRQQFPSTINIEKAKEQAGLLAPSLFIFALEEVLEKHTNHYGATRYFFNIFSPEIMKMYDFILRKGMTYPFRKYDMIYHPNGEMKDASASYFEAVPYIGANNSF